MCISFTAPKLVASCLDEYFRGFAEPFLHHGIRLHRSGRNKLHSWVAVPR
jgi:hypothetical protein